MRMIINCAIVVVMEAFALFISIVTIIIVLTQQSRISALEKRLRDLKVPQKREEKKPTPVVVAKKENIPPPTKPPVPPVKKVETKPKRENKPLLSDKFLSNWAGILGAVLLVMGFAFLGIYVAINMSPFSRFLLFVVVSLIILGSSVAIEKMKKVVKTALWLRSASGAIYLFACVGSIGIPGLIWVDNSISGVILLLTGVLANIALGQISKNEIIASAHVFLSLLAISIAPPTLITLLISGGVTIYGIYLTYRNRWDKNLLIIISLFFIFHLYWHFRMDDIDLQSQTTALISIVIISLLTLLSHYRGIYSVRKFDTVPFLTHFLNWIYLGTGLYLYAEIIPVRILLLALGSVIALFIAKNGKRLNIRWLFVTDTLVANFLMILAILSFYPRGVNPLFISSILLAEGFIFTLITVIEKDKLLCKIAYGINTIFGIAVSISGLITLEETSGEISSPLAVGITSLIAGGSYILFSRKSTLYREMDRMYKSIYSYIPGALVLVLYFLLLEYDFGSLPVIGLIPLIIFGKKINSKGLILSSIVAITVSTLFGWVVLAGESSSLVTALYLIPFLAVSGVLIGCRSNFSIYLLVAQLSFSAYILTEDISDYLPGALWILLSIVLLEVSKKVKRGSHLKIAGVSTILLYLIRHYTVILDLKYKLLFDLIVVLTIVYWIFRTRKEYRFITYHLLELLLIVAVIVSFLEVESNWQPVVWGVIGIGTLLYSGSSSISRVRVYSILFLWGAAFHLSFITTTNRGGIATGLITMALLSTYLGLFKSFSRLPIIDLSRSFKGFSIIRDKISLSPNNLIYFPVFISLALFILFEFNRDIITLMFVIESLIIFILSIILKEKSFKYLSMAGIAGSMVRLVLFDLNNSDTVIRALVFIGMGSVLVAMNLIYNKYMLSDNSGDD